MSQAWRRLQLLFSVGRAILTGRTRVQASGFEDDTPPDLHAVEPYGFSYFPPGGGEVYMLFPSGDRSRGFAIIHGHKAFQMELAQGEVAIHDDQGNHVHIMRGGIISVKAASKVLADTPLFETTGDAIVGGNLIVNGKTQSDAGYYGNGGGAATMSGGAHIKGPFTVNDVSIDENHGHSNDGAGPVIR